MDVGKAAVKMHGCRNPGVLRVDIGKVESLDVDGGAKGESKNHVRGDIGKVESMVVDGATKGKSKNKKDQSQGKPIKITLDSGAGASCWPEKLWKSIPMNPKTRRETRQQMASS